MIDIVDDGPHHREDHSEHKENCLALVVTTQDGLGNTVEVGILSPRSLKVELPE